MIVLLLLIHDHLDVLSLAPTVFLVRREHVLLESEGQDAGLGDAQSDLLFVFLAALSTLANADIFYWLRTRLFW